jgi:hypothetical protein
MPYRDMSISFMRELRQSEIPFDQPPYRTPYQPRPIHLLPPRSTKQYGFGEFENSPSSNNRLEIPCYE